MEDAPAPSSGDGRFAETQQRIEQLEQAVQDARKELQFFVYAASHDLQQPLRAVSTHAQLLQREFPDSVRGRELTGVILDAASQMSSLLTSLLAYSRNGNIPNRSQVNLNACLQSALYSLSAPLQQAGAQVAEEGELPEAFADEKQMATVFENLIGNAIKFRGEAPPRISIGSATEDAYHTISVTDNGCGIKPEYQQKVFEPFKRLHGRAIPGSGLGLSMCRKIVRAHEGRIWIESDGEHGTAVKFTLPV